jgi:hypothetical protein
MRGKRFSAMVAAWAVMAAGPLAMGAVPLIEDLAGCSLPNGVVTLPAAAKGEAGGAASAKGDLLKLSSGLVVPSPRNGQGQAITGDALMARMRVEHVADLQYVLEAAADGPAADAGGGAEVAAAAAAGGGAAVGAGGSRASLWAFSGRISDLGGRYLSQAASMHASRPMEIPSSSRGPGGTLRNIAEGHTYLVQTTEERYALVRVLEKTPEAVVLQYVYQPAGTLTFEVPDGEKLEYRRGEVAGVLAGVTQGTAPGAALAPPAGGMAGGTVRGGGMAGGTVPPLPPPVAAIPSATPPSPAGQGAPGREASGIQGMIDGAAPGSPGGAAASALPTGAGGDRGGGLVASGAGGRAPTTLPPAAPRTELGPRDMYEPGSGGRIVLLNDGGKAAAPGTTEPALENLVKQRDLMIQQRLTLVQTPARTPVEVERKAQAMHDLGTLRAEEAADLLVGQIGFFNARSSAREYSPEALHPAFAALKRIGKPASAAALRGIAGLTNLEAPAEGIESPWYKAGLMMQVIRAVEGNEVADFLVMREMQKAQTPEQRALYEHLLGRK